MLLEKLLHLVLTSAHEPVGSNFDNTCFYLNLNNLTYNF